MSDATRPHDAWWNSRTTDIHLPNRPSITKDPAPRKVGYPSSDGRGFNKPSNWSSDPVHDDILAEYLMRNPAYLQKAMEMLKADYRDREMYENIGPRKK